MSDPVPTPTLRPPSLAEQAWPVVATVLMLGVSVWYIALLEAPVPVVGYLGIAMMVGGAIAVLFAARELRAESGHRDFPRLQSLAPQVTQRQLLRELRAGRPGPPELWPFAWGWAARRITKRRGSPGCWFFLSGVQVTNCYAFNSPLPWWTAVIPAVCVLAGVAEAVLNRRAMEIAQTLARRAENGPQGGSSVERSAGAWGSPRP